MPLSQNISKYDYIFCGDPMWNYTLIWESETPNFTDCFQKSIVPFICFTSLLLFSGIELTIYSSQRKRMVGRIRLNYYNIIKLFVALSLALLDMIELALIIENDNMIEMMNVMFPSDYMSSSVFLVSHLISIVMLISALRLGLRRSYAQFIFYFTSTLSKIVVLRSSILSESIMNSKKELIIIQLALSLIMLFLVNVTDEMPQNSEQSENVTEMECPSISANILSKLTFAWVTPLIWKGIWKTLDPSMLWDLHPELTSRHVVPKFEKYYNAKLKMAKDKQEVPQDDENLSKSTSRFSFLLPSLFAVFGKEFGLATILQCVIVGASVLSPQVQKQMIGIVRNSYSIQQHPHGYPWKGIFYASSLFVIAIFLNLCNGQYYHRMFLLSLKIRSALSSSIFKKGLSLSNTERQQNDIGEILNLMELDVGMIMVSNNIGLPYNDMI